MSVVLVQRGGERQYVRHDSELRLEHGPMLGINQLAAGLWESLGLGEDSIWQLGVWITGVVVIYQPV